MRKYLLLMATIALFAVLPLSTADAGSVLNVPVDYSTIQTAIDAAASGDTILVAPGEYVESIELKAGVTVRSAEGPEVTVIRGDGSEYMYPNWTYTVLGADDSTLSGFTITGSQMDSLNVSSFPTITGNIITGAYGIYSATGVFNVNASPKVTNNIISTYSVAIYDMDSSSATITNNIITNIYRGIYVDRSSSTITNNIITSNYHGIIVGWAATPTITYNDLWGNYYGDIFIGDTGEPDPVISDNISVDPMFVEPAAGNYRIRSISPCIDAGTNDAPDLPDTDFYGNQRIADGNGDGIAIVDMGVYEIQPIPQTIEEINYIIQDLLSSGEIATLDEATSLNATLNSALQAQNNGNIQATRNILLVFIYQVQAQSGKKISEDAAALLIEAANQIRENLI